MGIIETMRFGELLQINREAKSLTKSALASRSGVSLTYIINLENSKEKPPTKERTLEIAKALNLSERETEKFLDTAMEERLNSEEIQWTESKNKGRLVPVISWVNANRFGTIEDPYPLGSSDELVPTATKGENVFALKIKNDCMFDPIGKHSFSEGEKIIVNPNAEVKSGDFAVVRDTKSQEATFKQYIKRGKKVILHPLNPKYPDIELDHDERYEIIGKVVGVYRDV